MSLRVVLLAEGGGELGSPTGPGPEPGKHLEELELGAAHHLVSRCLERIRNIPPAAVRFEEPLRTARGTLARGSDLHSPRILRRLVTYPIPARRPDLLVVLVDEDDDRRRRATIESALRTVHFVGVVVAVAVREFESWLITDRSTVAEVTEQTFDLPRKPELLPPREAKRLLADVISRSSRDPRIVRIEIARKCDLDLLKAGSRSFERFLTDLVP